MPQVIGPTAQDKRDKDPMVIPFEDTYSAAQFSPPLAQLAGFSDRASDLCDLLESIADDLPEMIPSKWRNVVVQSLVTVPQYYQMIARVLLPVLLQNRSLSTGCQEFLRRLHIDYLEAEDSLPEFQALLSDSSTQKITSASPDAIGYALRCFFEGIRRQTIWEKEVLLPFASRHLTQNDLKKVAQALGEINVAQHPASL